MSIAKQLTRVGAIMLGLAFAGSANTGLVSHAFAQQAQKRIVKPYKKKPAHRPAPRAERDDGRDFLRDPEDLPFGSTVWWRAMDLRQRGGFGGDR